MSADWSGGYGVETGYTYNTYPELNPVRAALPLLLKGVRAPKIQTACELGFGQGCSAAVHAAAQADVEWWGCDFAPAQAVFARDLVSASGAPAHFYDDSFEEFAQRPDLPDFDFVALHGIWSWVSEETRAGVVAFLRRKLKPGGVVYITYNTMPGWATAAPLRHLMKRHVDMMGVPALGPNANLDATLSTMQRFFALDPAYSRITPGVVERLDGIMRQDRTYLTHEYLGGHWQPMWFSEVEALLSPAKLSFGASAWMADHIDGLNLSPDMRAFLQDLPDPSLRETFRDVAVQAQFRRDYWLRGAQGLNPADQRRALRDQRVVLAKPVNERPAKTTGIFAETTLDAPIYDALYDLLGDHQPRTIGELEAAVLSGDMPFSDLTMALVALISQGAVAPAQAAEAAARSVGTAKALNLELARRAAEGVDLGFLAAPATGGALNASRFDQLFWLAMQDGGGPPDWARYAAGVLAAQGQALVAGGAPMSAEAAQAALEHQAHAFAANDLPCWRGLGIA